MTSDAPSAILPDQSEYDHRVDLIVVGAGAAGMACALVASLKGLNALLIEKTGNIGGCSALSAGQIWVPNSRQARSLGIDDDNVRAIQYLDEYLGDLEGRVLDKSGVPIFGLFSCGSDMNSIMMGEYVGSGINLGPALTFGYIVANTVHKNVLASG